MKKTAEALSQGNDSGVKLLYQSSPATFTPGLWELDSIGLVAELDASQISTASSSTVQTHRSSSSAHPYQTRHTSNRHLSIVSADSLYGDPSNEAGRRTDSVVNPPPPYVSGQRPTLPGGTGSERAVARMNRIRHSSSVELFLPPAHNHIASHGEDYVASHLRPGVVRRDVARPRNEPRVLTEEQVRRQRTTRLVVPVPETQPETTATVSTLVEQKIAEATSVVLPPTPSPEIGPVERVASLPHTLPPLDAFEAVSFSITMPGSAPTDSPVPPSNDPDTNNQWRWDIQF